MPIPWDSHFAVQFYAECWSEDKTMVQFDCWGAANKSNAYTWGSHFAVQFYAECWSED